MGPLKRVVKSGHTNDTKLELTITRTRSATLNLIVRRGNLSEKLNEVRCGLTLHFYRRNNIFNARSTSDITVYFLQ